MNKQQIQTVFPTFGVDYHQNGDGLAYLHPFDDGLTIRDWFAGLAMQGLMADPQYEGAFGDHHGRTAKIAYRLADAMMEARGRHE